MSVIFIKLLLIYFIGLLSSIIIYYKVVDITYEDEKLRAHMEQYIKEEKTKLFVELGEAIDIKPFIKSIKRRALILWPISWLIVLYLVTKTIYTTIKEIKEERKKQSN